MTMTYIKSACYTDDVHNAWLYLFDKLDDIRVVDINTDKTAVRFIPMTQAASEFIKLMNDCDMGVIMTERQAASYEEENGRLF